MPEPGTPVAVFARAPVPGEVKTRLIGTLGAQGAAALHRALVQRALQTALAADVGPVQLWCAPDASDGFFADSANTYGVTLAVQGEGDLGERMHRAFAALLARHPRALLVGADIPALTAGYLRDADAALRTGNDAVLGPAEDGGYVLIGLSRIESALFERIGWGGPEVLRETRVRIATLGWRHAELPMLWDVDRPEDLARPGVPGVA